MQLVKQCTPPEILDCHNELEALIGGSLIGDWMIRIEHKGDHDPQYSCWQQWGDTLFAITHPDSVMEAIYDCRSRRPTHAIRLYAEKVWPQSRLIYRVEETPDCDRRQQRPESGGVALPVSSAEDLGRANARVAGDLENGTLPKMNSR